jgi:hypothetical protein
VKVIDWIVRTLLLVLSGVATLAVIGAIAAIPAGGLPQGLEQIMPGDVVIAGGQAEGEAAPARAAPADAWAESLTYAVIALAGIAATGLIVLMRIAGHLGEIARRDRM